LPKTVCSLFAFFFCLTAFAQHKTENVIVVMSDGLRWQEIFAGADATLLQSAITSPSKDSSLGNGKARAEAAKAAYWRDTSAARREALTPFLWSEVAKHGQLYGNRELGSDAQVTNGLDFSYPGYSETLTGIADPRIDSNDKVPNPNATVFEWLNKKPAFTGRVAAFGAWDVFSSIFNAQRAGFLVNDGYTPLVIDPSTPQLDLLNHLKAETPRVWSDEPFDALPFYSAIEYVKQKKPRALFIGLGETDDWAHGNDYPEYLNAAHRVDSYLKTLWDLLQSMPEYQGKTTLIVTADHGRGNGAKWTDHGQKAPESSQIWMAFLGPDIAPLGERAHTSPVTQNQIAATLAALLGEDYRAEVPRAGAIADVLPK